MPYDILDILQNKQESQVLYLLRKIEIFHRSFASTDARLAHSVNCPGNGDEKTKHKRTWGCWRDHKWLATQLEWLRHLTENPLTLLPFLAPLPSLARVPVFLGAFSLYCSAQAHDGGRMKVRQMEAEPHWRDWATVERLKGGRMLKLNGEKVEKHSCFYIFPFFSLS